jgi:hypothetical protein
MISFIRSMLVKDGFLAVELMECCGGSVGCHTNVVGTGKSPAGTS